MGGVLVNGRGFGAIQSLRSLQANIIPWLYDYMAGAPITLHICVAVPKKTIGSRSSTALSPGLSTIFPSTPALSYLLCMPRVIHSTFYQNGVAKLSFAERQNCRFAQFVSCSTTFLLVWALASFTHCHFLLETPDVSTSSKEVVESLPWRCSRNVEMLYIGTRFSGQYWSLEDGWTR